MSIRQRNAHFKDWAAVCNALNVATESEARTALESSDNTFYYYVCYIKSTGEIYTHGKFYAIPYDDTELKELIDTIQTEIEDFQLVTGTALTQLNNEINDNEVVTANALTSLNNEVENLSNNKADKTEIPTAETVANWGFVTSNDFAEELLNSTRLSFYCVEPVDVVLNGETLTYEANSNVDMTISSDDTFEIVPTSDNSITALTAYPGALGTFYSWLEGVSIFSNIVFDMNDVAMYEKWNQGHQGQYHVQMAQYTNCIFWSDNPYISEINTRTNYTLYNSSQLPLCYSSIPANTFKTFYCAYGVTNDPNWSSSAYKESFAAATWATQVFSYYGMQTIGVYDQDSPKFNITLPNDCRGLMFAAASIENAGVFDAINTTNFGAKSGSWRDAFAYCYALTNLYIKNLKVSINISWSPINQSSLAFIIENAANTSAITISLSPHTYYQLTDDNKTNAAAKNITLELITANASQDSRLAWLINNGDGTKFLSDTGEYITPNYPSKVSQLENDSNYATLDDVSTAVSELVGSAPDTLDTLGELSAALKNDASIIETLESAITNKAEKSDIPTNTSELTNDSGFLTELPENLVTKNTQGELSCIEIDALVGSKDDLVYSLPGNSTGDEDRILVSNVELDEKQDKLISGTNIKTINGESLLGSGDITIEGGENSIYVTTFTLADCDAAIANGGEMQMDSILIWDAVEANKIIFIPRGDINGGCVALSSVSDDYVYLTCIDNYNGVVYYIDVTPDGSGFVHANSWSYQLKTINGQSLIGSGDIAINSADPVTEATVSGWGFTKNEGTITDVYVNNQSVVTGDIALIKLHESQTFSATSGVFSIQNNVKYYYPNALTGTTIFNLNSNTNSSVSNEWNVTFVIGSSVPSISFTVPYSSYEIIWANGEAPVFEANKFYEVSFNYINTRFLGVWACFN